MNSTATENFATATRNRLLTGLSDADRILISNYLEPVLLRPKQKLVCLDVPIEHVYFVERGMVSVNAHSDRRSIEVASIGREGMLGLPVILGQKRIVLHAHVQVPGSALRMRAEDLRSAMANSTTLNSALLSYAHGVIVEMANAVLFAGCRNVVERVANFLLKVSEKLNEPNIPLTHEAIARALGVRRPGVTNALHMIEGERAIRSQRSLTIITNRDKLEWLLAQPPAVQVHQRKRPSKK